MRAKEDREGQTDKERERETDRQTERDEERDRDVSEFHDHASYLSNGPQMGLAFF